MTRPRSRPPKALRKPERPTGLDAERDDFIQTFFRKGVQLTHDLLRENEQLRARNNHVEQENAILRLQVRSDEAIRDLLSKINDLEREKDNLVSQFHEAEERSTQAERVHEEVEEELSNLASLYVASKQLHSTIAPVSVLKHLREVLDQFVGARAYALHMSADGKTLVPVFSKGFDDTEIDAKNGVIRRIFDSGISQIEEGNDLPGCDFNRPAACIPLRLEDRTVGVLTIVATLEQKIQFLPVDYEFFKLLSAQTAIALVAASLIVEAGGRIPSVDALRELGV